MKRGSPEPGPDKRVPLDDDIVASLTSNSNHHHASGLIGIWPHATQKEHWDGWLESYDGPGGYGRKNWNRTPEYVYNHVVNPQMLVYLAEASGLPHALVRKAAAAALARAGSSMSGMSSAVRRVLPWSRIEAALVLKAR